MEPNVLASLVAEVIRSKKSTNVVKASNEQKTRFYREFESEVSDKIQKIRSDKRRAYEELKNIAIG